MNGFTRMTVFGCLAFLLLGLGISTGFSQEARFDDRPLLYYMDHVTFPKIGDPTAAKLEVICGFEIDQLTFRDQDDQSFAAYGLEIRLFDGSGEFVDGTYWNQEVSHTSEEFGLRSRALLLPHMFTLPPGTYTVRSVFLDSLSGRRAELEKEVEVADFSGEPVRLSGIELATRISGESGGGPFDKYGITVIPRPNRTYTSEDQLNFYCEIVNLQYDAEEASGYTVQYLVNDEIGNTVLYQGPVTKKKVGTATTEASAMNIAELETGQYTLAIVATDLGTMASDTSTVDFMVVRPREEVKSELTQEMADNFYHMTYYIMTKQERDLWNTLDLTGKTYFMINYWKRRDPDPDTAENEFQKELFSRWTYVCNNYGGVERAWKRDRGRIVLKYGMPTEVERHYHDVEMKPHEIWRYHNGNMTFIFVDLRNKNEYTLISAITPDNSEFYDPDWERWLRLQ